MAYKLRHLAVVLLLTAVAWCAPAAPAPHLNINLLASPFPDPQFTSCPSANSCPYAVLASGAWGNWRVDASGNLLAAIGGAPANATTPCPYPGACPYGVNPSGQYVNLNVDATGHVLLNLAAGQCAVLDYAICASSVDANGNPNAVAAGAGGAVTVTGTGLSLFIQGVYQTGTGTYSNVVTGTTSNFNYLYVKQDTTNANLVAADFAATVLAPVYSYKAPTACTGASAGAPQYWFDLSSRQWKVSTAAGCSFSVASPQVLFLAVFWVTATPTVSGVAPEPYNLGPYRRFELFGDGFDSLAGGTDITKQTLTSGSTTIDNFHSYTTFVLTGATVVPTLFAASGATQGMTVVYSQNPVLIVNTSNVNANALGRAGGNAATTTCQAGNSGGLGGAGGGGGGASASNAGCAGAGRPSLGALSAASGGGALGAIGNPGGTGTSTPTLFGPLSAPYMDCGGSSGGSGGGDGGAASGGAGGGAGGCVVIRAPAVIEDASSTIAANGGNGGNGGGTNGGGGGGGGGGIVAVHGSVVSLAGTKTANAGTGGTLAGAGAAGGNGTAGIVQTWRIF